MVELQVKNGSNNWQVVRGELEATHTDKRLWMENPVLLMRCITYVRYNVHL